MKFDNRFFLVIIGAITLYAVFLMITDFSLIASKISNFKIIYLPIILLIIPIGWLSTFIRWNFLLKNSGISIPVRENIKIYLAGFAFVLPAKFGELIKSQILKTKYDVPHKTTTSLVLTERLYDLAGAVAVSFLGLLSIGMGAYIIVIALLILIVVFAVISSRTIFNHIISLVGRIKFLRRFEDPLSDSYETVRISTRGKMAFVGITTSSISWLLESLAVYCILLAFDIDIINYFAVVATYASSLILGAASFIPGGLGVAEGSLLGMLSSQGVEISMAFVLVVLIRVFTLWYSVIVGLFSLKLSGGLTGKSKSN
jgi:uncharacterized protein (TIRG00374 family)